MLLIICQNTVATVAVDANLDKSMDGQVQNGQQGEASSGNGRKRHASQSQEKDKDQHTSKDKGKKPKKDEDEESSSEDSSSEVEEVPAVTSHLGMFATPNEPLTDHVDSKTKKKVIKGQYVELNKLFRRDVSQASNQVLSFENGSLQLKDDGSKKIWSFSMWLDCFIVYMTIRGKKFPDEMMGMLKHVETVKRLSTTGFDAIAYDIRFRHMKANYGALPWGQYLPEIVSVAKPAKKPFERSKSTPFQSQVQSNQSSGFSRGICRFFNAGSCSKNPCNFKHVCSKCQAGGHNASQCKK